MSHISALVERTTIGRQGLPLAVPAKRADQLWITCGKMLFCVEQKTEQLSNYTMEALACK